SPSLRGRYSDPELSRDPCPEMLRRTNSSSRTLFSPSSARTIFSRVGCSRTQSAVPGDGLTSLNSLPFPCSCFKVWKRLLACFSAQVRGVGTVLYTLVPIDTRYSVGWNERLMGHWILQAPLMTLPPTSVASI